MPRTNIEIGTIYIEDMHVGLTRSISKTFTDHDINMYAQVSEDYNPLHLDDDYANATMFNGRIAHGMLTGALLSAIIGEQLPGHGAVYLKQEMQFLAPVRPGDHVTATITVAEIFPEKRRVRLDCACRVGDKLVMKGEALVLAPSRNQG